MAKYLSDRSRDEGGFTMVELIMYLLILSIMFGTATYFFVSMRDVSMLNNAAQEVKVAMQRAVSLAGNENQKITLTFYGSGNADYPNSYAFVRANGEAEEPALGNSYTEVGGVYYVKLQDGQPGLNISSDVSVVCTPQGTVLDITPAVVTVGLAGRTKTISVSKNGEVSF